MTQRFSMFLLGRATLGMAAALLPPLACALAAGQGRWQAWLCLFFLYMGMGAGMLVEGRRHERQVDAVHSAEVMLLLWLLLAFLGMLPYFCLGWLGLADALFEAVSTATTTGLTLLPPEAPAEVWLWRAELGWLGGMNFLMMLVTVLPQVSGCFGLTLAFRRGMMFSSMLGQMSYRGRQILGVYVFLTALAWGLYVLAGVAPLAALEAAFLVISTTGGVMPGVLAADGNPWPEAVTALALLLAAGNFLRYWRTFQRRDFKDYYSNPEVRFFLTATGMAGAFLALHLWGTGAYGFGECLLHAFFHVLSFAGTAGLQAASLALWPDADQYVLLLLAFLGGCLGSATGGLKAMRFIVLFKMLRVEVRRTLHPHMVANVVVGGSSVEMKILGRILSFFFLYAATFFLFVLLVSLSGLGLSEAVGCAVACFTTLGTALGVLEPAAMAALPVAAKVLCAFFMLVGRMEIFAFLILLSSGAADRRKRW